MTVGRLAVLAGALLAALAAASASAEGPARLVLQPELPEYAGSFDGSCTAGRTVAVEWSAVRGDQPVTEVRIDGVPQEGSRGVALVWCPALRSDWRVWAARYGAPVRSHEVRGTALAPDGREATALLRLRVRAPLPTPADVAAPSYPRPGLLEVRFRDEGRTDGGIVARWRSAEGGDWQAGPSAPREILPDGEGRHRATIAVWLDAGVYELQAARVRGEGETAGLAEADWSEAVVLDLSDAPPRVTAEAARDSITVRSVDGSAITDLRWGLFGPCHEDDGSVRRSYPACSVGSRLAADTGESAVVRWRYLVPDSEYHLSWSAPGGAREGWQHLFPLRTLPAPAGYAPSLAGAEGKIEGKIEGKAVEVGPHHVSLRWESPPEARHPYRISAYDFGAETAISELAAEASSPHDIVLDGLRPGAAYRIEVVRERPDGMEFGTRFIVETHEGEFPGDDGAELDERPDAPVGSYRSQQHLWLYYASISAAVPDGERWTELEYEWRFGGRTMRRLSTDGLWLSEPLRGVYEIRARGRRDGRWSGWSEPAIVATRPPAPTAVRGERIAEGARITWTPDLDAPPAVEYVVRWSIDEGPISEMRGLSGPQVVLPAGADALGTLRAIVAAIHPELGEGEQSHPFEMRLDQPLSATISSRRSFPCLPEEGAPCEIWLSIWGGAAPYETRVDEQARMVDSGYGLEFEYGDLVVEEGISWEVRDALGASVSGAYRHRPFEFEADAALPHQIEMGRLHATPEGEIIALWHCRPRTASGGSARYVARWREVGGRHWIHEQKSGQTWVRHGLGISRDHQDCLNLINGVRPGGAYEVGVAALDGGIGVAHPDDLRWSDAWVVTVPMAVEDVRVSLEAAGARVSWSSQPDVPRYVVALHCDGRRWRRSHAATGSMHESALFNVPLSSTGCTAEVIIPDGAEGWPAASGGP